MPITAKELTDLVTETIKAKQSVEKILDYVDLMNNHLDVFPNELENSGARIKEIAPEIVKNIEKMRKQINAKLNKLPVDIDQAKDAANKLMLYHGDAYQVINWSETQKKNHEENSYWWRYWQIINETLREQLEKNTDIEG